MFGWRASNSNAPTEQDFQKNGKYCQSGLAYPVDEFTAKCTSFKQMMFDGQVVPYPFPCNPQDQNKKCMLYFNVDPEDKGYSMNESRYFVQNQCKCALNGNSTAGYCSNVLGT